VKVIDYTNTGFGLLVKHSPHWLKECNYKPDRHKIGMIVDRAFYKDSVNGVMCWPIVRWEGLPMGHACHPCHIVPWRKRELDKAKWVEVEG
jgi:hypothetical protein